MTTLLRQTVERVEKLDPAVQDALAARWLAELEVNPLPDDAPVTLRELLIRITPGTLHGEVETGPARGSEAW